jgi:hypothetical protein
VKPFPIISALICEDIRQEATGKFSLAGVFGSSLKIGSVPSIIAIGVFAEVQFTEKGEFNPDFRVLDPSGNQAIIGKLKLLVQNTETGPISAGPFPVQITAQGKVKFQWKFGTSAWKTIKEFNVIVDPSGPPPISFPSIAPSPPS